jgi:hypothetical protein
MRKFIPLGHPSPDIQGTHPSVWCKHNSTFHHGHRMYLCCLPQGSRSRSATRVLQ